MHDDSAETRPHPGGQADLGNHRVARIGFGAMQLARFRDDPDAGLSVLHRAVELGVDHIDTAEFYGDGFVNDLIRRAIPGDGDVVIATKVGAVPDPDGRLPLKAAQRPHELRQAVEDNLRSLDRETLPVVNLRRLELPPGLLAEGDQDVDLDDQLAEMVALRDEGKIGAIGLSAVTSATIRRALPAGIVCVQNCHNLLDRRLEDGLRLCTDEHIAWVPFFPLGSSFESMSSVTNDPTVVATASAVGATPAQVGLAWLLGRAPDVLLIPGTGDPEHLVANLAAGDLRLDAETTARLDVIGRQSDTT
ncbi:aldo/keto reductase [Williamsia sterculiae]|uniref:Predicted oxidoreductase n=1 Tax=Williamsia sterculiae TaxID=1344003 RepID=A0A1N7CKL0_9NOCA|nr:aldo/keto reductase [Williamsia sterculiae]SIR64156.1 Predicted oxidoreductase [Williamsia sterculiae]